MNGAGQSAVIAFLEAPETHGGVRPTRIDTHLSHVFLTDQDAFKLKRAVRLDFVDYSTVDLRAAYCRREIDANRAWAKDLYRGVVAVRRQGTSLILGGKHGEIVDWVVHMQRFDDASRLDRRLAAGRVGAPELSRFADDLAALHSRASPDDGFGGHAAMQRLIHQISSGLIDAKPDGLTTDDLNGWREALLTRMRARARHLDRRRRDGFVRRCHGDLHLKNICLWKGALIGFDALEFDDEMRTIDVLYDLAFPVMDLIQAGRTDAANLILNRYLARTRDYAGLDLFDLYLSLRAGVRALACALSDKPEDTLRYFSAAKTLIADRAKPRLIAIGGRSGTGKSTIAANIAPTIARCPGAIVLRSDVIRKIMAGIEPEAPLGPSAYAASETAKAYGQMFRFSRKVLKAGYACILDATFLNPVTRRRIKAFAAPFNIVPDTIWLEAPPPLLRDRILQRRADASDADLSVLNAQLARPAPSDWLQVNAAGTVSDSVEATIEAILSPHPDMFSPRQDNPAHDF